MRGEEVAADHLELGVDAGEVLLQVRRGGGGGESSGVGR